MNAESDSFTLAERERLKDCDLEILPLSCWLALCEPDCETLANKLAERLIERLCDTLMDSCKLAERDIERECDTLMLSCKLADLDAERLPLCEILCETLWLCDLLWLFDFDIEVETLNDAPAPDSDLLRLTLMLSCKLADCDLL